MTRSNSRITFGKFLLIVFLLCVLVVTVTQCWRIAHAPPHAGIAAGRDVKDIERAWRHYYSEYNRWPTLGGIPLPMMEVQPVRLSGDALAILMGTNINGSNPRGVQFISEFKNVNADGTPINPWGDESLTDAATPPESFYYMKFDVNFDRTLQSGRGPDNPPTNSINRPLIVWTIYPDEPVESSKRILGSWP